MVHHHNQRALLRHVFLHPDPEQPGPPTLHQEVQAAHPPTLHIHVPV